MVDFSFFDRNNDTKKGLESFLMRSCDWPVVGELQGHLDEGVWTQLVLLGEVFAEPLEVEDIDVEVVDQSAGSLNSLLELND